MMLALALAASLAAPASPAPDTVAPAREPRVLWQPEAFGAMRFLYERITSGPQGVEFAACLRAHRREGDWVITEIVIPPQSGNSASGISDAQCPEEFAGIAHSHPFWNGQRNCYPSFADRATWRETPHALLVIWCDRESFEYRTRDGGIGGKDTALDPRSVSGLEPYLVQPKRNAPAHGGG